MATLADKLKRTTRDATGQLAEQTPEEIQSLATKAGLQAAPLTPLGTAAIGGNPHQQKMAGTPNQKLAALTLSTSPSKDLATATRQAPVRSQATAQEQSSLQKSQDLQSLGGVGDRVNDLINAQRVRIASAAPVEAQAVDQFNGKDLSTVKPLLAQLRANPADMNLQLQVNKALGYDISRQLSPDEINSLYENSVSAISKGVNGNVDHDLTVTDLIDNGEMGYDAPTLAHLLNVPEAQLATMTVAQLRNQINQVQADEFSKSGEIDQAQQSTQLGTAERQLVHQAGQEAARVGTRRSEADVQGVEDQIAAGDVVQFGGREYTVEDLLSDGKISDIISNYMSSAPGSPERLQLEATEPQLLEFINKNQAILQDASERLSKGASAFHNVQEANRIMLSRLPENIRSAVLPGGQQLSADTINPSQYPLLAWAQQNPEKAAQLASATPEDARALAQLNPQEVEALQIGTPGGKWEKYLNDKRAVEDLRRRTAQATSSDDIIKLVFGGSYSGDYNKLASDYRQERQKAALGLPNNFDQFRSLDPNNDGEIEGASYYLDKFRNAQAPSIQDELAGRGFQDPTRRAPTTSNNPTGVNQKIQSALGEAVRDGKLTVDEVLSSARNLSDDEIRSLADAIDRSSRSGVVSIESGEGGMRGRLDSLIVSRKPSTSTAANPTSSTAATPPANRAVENFRSKFGKEPQIGTDGIVRGAGGGRLGADKLTLDEFNQIYG